jgi:hypothetical protein
VARESDLEQRERHDKEKDTYRKDRQVRLGHVMVPEEEPKPKSRAKDKEKAPSQEKEKATSDKKE